MAALKDLVTKHIKNGEGVPVLARALIDNGLCTDYEEASRIAQYEMLLAYSVKGQKSIMENPAMNRKRWKYTGDYRNDSEHCRNHASLDGVIVPKGEPFTLVGLDGKTYYPMHPRDSVLPTEERMECKCTHQGITENYEEFEKIHKKAMENIEIEDADDRWEYELDIKNRKKAGIKTKPLSYEDWKKAREKKRKAKDGI